MNRYVIPLFLCLLVFGVQERDWINDWPTDPLPRSGHLRVIDECEVVDFPSITVTCAYDCGRFGDQLINYMRTLWLSMQYDLPFAFRPFFYSDELITSSFHDVTLTPQLLHSFDAKLESYGYQEKEKGRSILSKLGCRKKKGGRLLWNVGYFTPIDARETLDLLCEEPFRSEIEKRIQPKRAISLVPIPEERIPIAIHVRTGVGYDLEMNRKRMVTKFVPDSFYHASLRIAAQYFKGKPLYVHIFTDDPNPREIEEKLRAAWKGENDIVFGSRHKGNRHDQNVLTDFFSLKQFSCIIHGKSSFSEAAAIIAAPELELTPLRYRSWRCDEAGNPIFNSSGQYIIDPVLIVRDGNKGAILNKAQYRVPSDLENM